MALNPAYIMYSDQFKLSFNNHEPKTMKTLPCLKSFLAIKSFLA